MKIKAILFCIVMLLANYSFCKNSVSTDSRIDSLQQIQKSIDLKQDNKFDSLSQINRLAHKKQQSEIKTVQEFENVYKIKESLFSNQLTILTTIFSAIIAIVIFIIGYLLPKVNDEKHKKEIDSLLSEFKTIRDEIKQSREETAKLEIQNNYNNSKLMFFSCQDTGTNKHGELLWALRHCKDNFIRYKDPIDEDIVFFIDTALEAIPKLISEHSLKDFADEVNILTNELMEVYTLDGIKEKLIQIKEGYNKAAWTDK